MFRSWFLAALLTVGPALATPNVRVTLSPPDLTGQPGETVYWNFMIETVSDISNMWAVVSDIQFLPDTPMIGTYLNYGGSFGLLNSYTIDANAQPGDLVRGDLRFSISVYYLDNSYMYGPTYQFIGNEDVNVATSIAVPLSGQDTPEASTLGMVVAELAAVFVFPRRTS